MRNGDWFGAVLQILVAVFVIAIIFGVFLLVETTLQSESNVIAAVSNLTHTTAPTTTIAQSAAPASSSAPASGNCASLICSTSSSSTKGILIKIFAVILIACILIYLGLRFKKGWRKGASKLVNIKGKEITTLEGLLNYHNTE